MDAQVLHEGEEAYFFIQVQVKEKKKKEKELKGDPIIPFFFPLIIDIIVI
jgi:hypothetical protein